MNYSFTQTRERDTLLPLSVNRQRNNNTPSDLYKSSWHLFSSVRADGVEKLSDIYAVTDIL